MAVASPELAKTSTMSKCANPDCSAPFDDRSGRFFRFHRPHGPDETPANHHSVWHFWLCQRCSEIYTLETRGTSVQIFLRLSHAGDKTVSQQAKKATSWCVRRELRRSAFAALNVVVQDDGDHYQDPHGKDS